MDKKLRIAVVTNCFLPNTGGGEFVVHHLSNQWSMQGHDVCVFNSITAEATHPEACYAVKKYKILRGATRFGYHRFPWKELSSRSLNRLINEFNPDIIFGHFAIPVAFYLENLKPARKWVITSHGTDIVAGFPDSQRDEYRVDKILERALNKAYAVVSISKIAHESLEQLNVDDSRIKYIPNGVDIDKFSAKSPVDFAKLINIPKHAKYMLTIGRYSAQKNISLGIRAFAEITDEFPDLYYVIVGWGVTKLADEIASYGLESRVITFNRLVGDELIAAYQQAYLYISTSYWEFCPLVVLESFGAGLPLIATNVPGNMDLIEDGVNGILVDSDNHTQLAQAVSSIMNDSLLHQAMRQSNLAKAQSYSWAEISRKYLELI